MGKNDFLTPKAIGNRIKAKGLGKLRWFCQMCQKQCRDENGFKCHLNSDSHRRQMEVFGQNPDRVMDGYSDEFHRSFMEHLKMAHPNVRIEAHKVYNEYIQDKQHIHMNATKFLTLSEYVKYLGREGFCTVEESPKGWFIRLIHRDVQQEELEAERKKRKRAELAESNREERKIEAQIALAREIEGTCGEASPEHETAQRDGAVADLHEREQPLQLSLAADGAKRDRPAEDEHGASGRKRALFEQAQPAARRESGSDRAADGSAARKRSKVEELMHAEKERRERSAAAASASAAPAEGSGGAISGPWVARGIAVKVTAEHLEDYFRKKGVIVLVLDDYVAEVEMTDSGDVLRIDQAELETVIPKVGGEVMVLVGKHKGDLGVVTDILKDKFLVQIELHSGKAVLQEYEHVSKYAG